MDCKIRSTDDSLMVSKTENKRKADDLEGDPTRKLQARDEDLPAKYDFSGISTSLTTTTPFDSPTTPKIQEVAGCNQHARENNNLSISSSPLPVLSWADRKEVWQVMIENDNNFKRSPDCFDRHPNLVPNMRGILLDWMMEVCESFKMQRETFYMAMDYLDRYLSLSDNILKQKLQLIGTTCLFIAAKIEEIQPPQVSEFAYVTDSACSEDDIIKLELQLLQTLEFQLSPVTVTSWLNVYVQLFNIKLSSQEPVGDMLYPTYCGDLYMKAIRLIDLCILDSWCLMHSYRSIAASAFYLIAPSKQLAIDCTGYLWENLTSCISWMMPKYETVKKYCTSYEIQTINNIPKLDLHRIQTHHVDLTLLEKSQVIADKLTTNAFIDQPASPKVSEAVITPPDSSKKKKFRSD